MIDTHDLRLVFLAVFVCVLSAVAAIELARHARHASRATRAAWIGIAAFAGGSGIWATHFIAMLAFSPGVQSAYEFRLTVLSLVFAVVLTGLGLAASLQPNRTGPLLGGIVLGLGIAAMHYTGMAAFETAGHLQWHGWSVAVSILASAALAGTAIPLGLRGTEPWHRIASALLLVLAICAHHFIGMGALTIVPDPTIVIAPGRIPTDGLAVSVGLASVAILVLAGAAAMLDIRERRRVRLGASLRSLANAAVEGLLICKGANIVTANESFSRLAGVIAADCSGAPLARFLSEASARSALAAGSGVPVEAQLICPHGENIPVELIAHPVAYADEPHLAIAVRDLRARHAAERQIRFLARQDALTGAANRATFNEHLEQEIEAARHRAGRLAILFLDLDRFKEVNDLHGHAAGDALLIRVARRIGDVLAEDQLLARLGGDEFAVMARVADAEDAQALARGVLAALDAGDCEVLEPMVATSIGIAIYPDDACDRVTLLTHADTALYRAKGEARGTFRHFEAWMGVEIRDRHRLAQDLRLAIDRHQMEIAYQPQTDVATGAVIGFEALLRWYHPERGQVSPAEFIPIAEENGLILKIGEWVLREACREAAGWPNKLAIAVNVSAVQIHRASFLTVLGDILRQTKIEPGRLKIEITETALIRDPVNAHAILTQVSAMGVRIAMDDFGTGYSSLSNLRTFPFDEIKIDGSFVRSVDSNRQAAAIIRSVIGLGRGLDLRVVAEGVESEAELRFLKAERCHTAQGYLIGRPGPIALLREHTHGRTASEQANLETQMARVA